MLRYCSVYSVNIQINKLVKGLNTVTNKQLTLNLLSEVNACKRLQLFDKLL